MKQACVILASAIALSACGGDSSNALVASDPVTSEPGLESTPVQPNSGADGVNAPDDTAATDNGAAVTEQLPEQPGSTPYVARATDPVWRVCAGDIGIDSRDSWQRQLVQSGTYRDCIKACPTNSDFIPDPDFPGLGWDNRLRSACAVIDNPEDQLHHPVPLYLPGQQPFRQSFNNVSAFQLHAGGGQWQCAHQQRSLSSDPFANTGVEISYQFFGDGAVDTQNNSSRQSSRGLWWFDGFIGTRVIGVPTGTTDEGLLPERYIGNVQLTGNSMQIYRTTVDRLSCSSERASDTLRGYPESPDELATLTVLSLDSLLNKPLRCQAYESLALSLDGQSFTQIGQRSNLESPQSDVFINITPSASVDASGQSRYEFENDSTTSYTLNDEGAFDSTYRHPGEVTRSFAYHLIKFRQYNDRIIMTDRYAIGGSGSSSLYVTDSLCVEVQ